MDISTRDLATPPFDGAKTSVTPAVTGELDALRQSSDAPVHDGSFMPDHVLRRLADQIVERISHVFDGDRDERGGAKSSSGSGAYLARKAASDDGVSDSLEQAIDNILGVGRAIADRTRIRILQILASEKELNVRALCKRLHQSQPSVSHHLAQMRSVGLVSLRRDGKNNFYCLETDRLLSFLSSLDDLGVFATQTCDDKPLVTDESVDDEDALLDVSDDVSDSDVAGHEDV